MTICYEQKINLLDAVKIFTEKDKERKNENRIFNEIEKENMTYEKEY